MIHQVRLVLLQNIDMLQEGHLAIKIDFQICVQIDDADLVQSILASLLRTEGAELDNARRICIAGGPFCIRART